jgi:hypothetical protein
VDSHRNQRTMAAMVTMAVILGVFSKRVATRRELLELGDATFDDVALSIEMSVEGVFSGWGC